MRQLVLQNVSYAYPGSNQPLLTGINCTLTAGELVLLTGANGSGKSTLARMITGLIAPDSGEITGRREPASGWNGVGLVMQDPSSQMLTSSVVGELAWGLENIGLELPEIARKTEHALVDFGLTGIRYKSPEVLADGELQLVATAATSIMEPDFIVFDEATAYLDLKWRRRVWNAARQAAERCGVIWISTRDSAIEGVSSIWKIEAGRLSIRNT